jgi:hypothetical protein
VTGQRPATSEARRLLAGFGVDAVLAGIRTLTAVLSSETEVWADEDAERLAAFVVVLDEHISGGGALPSGWDVTRSDDTDAVNDEDLTAAAQAGRGVPGEPLSANCRSGRHPTLARDVPCPPYCECWCHAGEALRPPVTDPGS